MFKGELFFEEGLEAGLKEHEANLDNNVSDGVIVFLHAYKVLKFFGSKNMIP